MCEWQGGKPWRGMKVKALAPSGAGCLGRRPGPPLVRAALSTDHDSLMKDSSVSTDVGTRKMVNYA
jgi:hypothetical protein